MISLYDEAGDFWFKKMAQDATRPWQVRLENGDLGLAHYKGFLLETFHNTGYNPQLQAFATMYIPENPREIVKKFFLHASSEISHDLLALEDLKNLGVSEKFVRSTRPLPTTSAFFANTVYNIQFKGPTSYLAYLFHLEFSPTQNGEKIIGLLKSKGIPDSALSFIDEHSKVDVAHLKLMKSYLEELVTTPNQKKLFFDSLEDCIFLHNRVLEEAFENGEKIFPLRR